MNINIMKSTNYPNHCIVVMFSILFYSFPSIKVQEKSEWPCFHGSDRYNKSIETGLLKEWPDDGPELLWTVSGLGKGYSFVSIADGLLFTSGIDESNTVGFAFDLDGNPVWNQTKGDS